MWGAPRGPPWFASSRDQKPEDLDVILRGAGGLQGLAVQLGLGDLRPGPGFHGSLANVDVSGDPNIGHISIDKSPRLHARAISEVLAVIKGHRVAAPSAVNPSVANPPAATREGGSAKVPPDGNGIVKPGGKPAPEKSGDGAINSTKLMSPAEGSAPSLRSPTDGTRPKGGRPDRLDPAQLPN
jgi:hypothetical protein